MYTAFDFINSNIPSKNMRFGWKIETSPSLSSCIVLKYDMLNFDWKSMEWLGPDAMNMFLQSESYHHMKLRREKAMSKYKRLHFIAVSVTDLKLFIKQANLKIDIDKLLDNTIKKLAEKQKLKKSLVH